MEPLLVPVDLTMLTHTSGYGAGPCTGCGSAVYIDSLNGSSHCAESCDGPTWPPIDWVIVGGESGPKARPMHPDWVRSLRDQCQAAGVAFLFKQWGTNLPVETDVTAGDGYLCWAIDGCGELLECRHKIVSAHYHEFSPVGKKAAGRMLDGRTWDEVPA